VAWPLALGACWVAGCAGLPAPEDGGARALDDAGGEARDAGVSAGDAGSEDGGAIDADAGATTPDASVSPPDAGVTTPDASVSPPDAGLQRAVFSPTTANFPDAERGFFRFVDDLSTVSATELRDVFTGGHRLAYTLIRLDAVRTTAIGATRLAAIETGLGRFRAAGVKAIVRVAYNYPQNETQYRNAQDASLVQLRAHLAELAPVFARNADVIAFFQAGFIGAWGEWHTSSNNLTTPTNKLAVRDALLASLPASRTISFRYPPDLRAWYPTAPTVADRLSGVAPRVGFHNDCFMASPTDVGTFEGASGPGDRALMQAFGRVAPFGGETCDPADDPNPSPRLGCAAIRTEGRAYGLTYLNLDYWTSFHDSWRAGGCFDEVARSMGHRLQLDAVELPVEAAAGATVPLTVTLTNTGWARLHNPRPLVAWWVSGASAHRALLEGADVRAVGSGETRALAGSVALPPGVTAGAWALWLSLPDGATSLENDPRYSSRFANADDATKQQRWEAATARFATGLSVRVR